MTFRNALRVLYNRVVLSEIFTKHGSVVAGYGAILRSLCDEDPVLRDRLDAQERDAQSLAHVGPATTFAHTTALLCELADRQEWDLLREQAKRRMDSPDLTVAVLARRMLAFSMAHSDDPSDREAAIELYRSLVNCGSSEFRDAGNLATLLIDGGNSDEARAIVLQGIGKFPARAEYFAEIGQRIVATAGDRGFREKMKAAIVKRGKGD